MPKNINITIRDKIALAVDQTEYICGNSDFIVNFDFDEEWNEFTTKTARFTYNGKFIDVPFQDNQCQVPIIHDTCKVCVGVYAGNLRTTTHAVIVARKSILCGDYKHEDPAPDVYNQLIELFEKVSTQMPYIGENGNWYVEGQDTGVPATGDDGTSVYVLSVTESTEDGGRNVVKFSDGKTMTVKNGSKGSKGESVTVSNVTESTEDGGNNIVTFSDGKKLNVKNGSKGSKGDSPVRGKDYWTEADKAEIAEEAARLVDAVPSYWQAELDTKSDAIQVAMESAGRNKSAFLWYTDAHWPQSAKMSPVLLDYLCKNTSINKVNFGGDIVGDPSPYDHENIKYVYDWRKRISGLSNHHSVYGNHDLNHWTTDVHKIAYALLIAPEESAEMVVGGDSYYYIDNPSEKTRYLYLSYLTKSQTEMMVQGQFIVDALKGTPEGWHIVAIAHRWWQYSSSATPTVGSVPAYENDILSVFDAYNARKTRGGSNYFYAQDFTEAKGRVEFCIGGHIHVDYDFESDGGIPVIITAADTNQERSPDETEDSGTIGTTTESAVFGIIADYTDTNSTKITVVGVGRGTSRVVRGSAMKLTSISNITYSGDTTVGATIDKSKFSFTATYSNGTTDTITGATSVNPATIGVVGNNSVTITYTEGAVTVTETVTIVGTAAPVVRLLSLDRTYEVGPTDEYVDGHLDESKAYTNVAYSSTQFNAKACTVSNTSEDSVTLKESGAGGVTVAYAIHLPDIVTDAYRITFDYSGTGKCRTYYRYATEGGKSGNNVLFTNDTSGASGHADVVIPANTSGYTWLVIMFGSNTSGTKTFENVTLTKAE